MRIHPFKDRVVELVPIQAKIKIGAQVTTSLALTFSNRRDNLICQRIDRARIGCLGKAQERDEVSRSCKPKSQHERIFCLVDELINAIWLEGSLEAKIRLACHSWKRRDGAVSIGPLVSR